MTTPVVFPISCDLRFLPRGEALLILHLEAADCAGQVVNRETLSVIAGDSDAQLPVEAHTMPESGNRLLRIWLPAEHAGKQVTVAYHADIGLQPEIHDPTMIPEVAVQNLPFSVQPYVMASRYCQSDRLGLFAEKEFGHLLSGHSRVTAICNWVRDYVKYQDGSSTPLTTAHDTLTARVGVCRDFAHLAIAFCRALSIPARFVSAYSAGIFPQDFHALFEAYLGDRWYLFDPTRLASVDRAVRIGVGRDAKDVSFATIYGEVTTTMPIVRVDLPDALEEERTVKAVSYSET